jgi:hypothetical protein
LRASSRGCPRESPSSSPCSCSRARWPHRVHSRWPIEAGAAAGCALALVAVGALSLADARDAIGDLGPTVGFLAALLV